MTTEILVEIFDPANGQLTETGPKFTGEAYGHNLAFFCPKCKHIWATTTELRLFDHEPIKRGCSPLHAWYPNDRPGSLILETQQDLFRLGPKALFREVILALNLPHLLPKSYDEPNKQPNATPSNPSTQPIRA